MIPQNLLYASMDPNILTAAIRGGLTRADAQLVVALLADSSVAARENWERKLTDQGLDALLDEVDLWDALLERRLGAFCPLPLFCYVAVRRALLSAGETNRQLADYVATVVLEFGFRERAYQVARNDDATFDTLASILAAEECSDERRRFLVRAHLGNYALWICGLFPDMVESRRARRGGPGLGYFEEMGSAGYSRASRMRVAADHGLEGVLQEAAEQFPKIRVALNSISDRTLFAHVQTPERLLRQVADERMFRLPT